LVRDTAEGRAGAERRQRSGQGFFQPLRGALFQPWKGLFNVAPGIARGWHEKQTCVL